MSPRSVEPVEERATAPAAMLLDQLDDTQFVRQVAAVSTPGLQVKTLQTIRHELLKR